MFWIKIYAFVWYIFYFPLILLNKIILFFTQSYFQYHLNHRGAEINYSLKICLYLEKHIVRDFEGLLQNQKDWILSSLDKTTKDKLMVKAIDPTKAHDYIAKQDLDLDKSSQTIWKVKYLTSSEQFSMRDDMYQVKGVAKARTEKFMTGTSEKKALKLGLTGWVNFCGDDGKPIEFNPKEFDAMLDMIPPNIRSELAAHIRGDSELDEGEE